jgi:hypothetical protein
METRLLRRTETARRSFPDLLLYGRTQQAPGPKQPRAYRLGFDVQIRRRLLVSIVPSLIA